VPVIVGKPSSLDSQSSVDWAPSTKLALTSPPTKKPSFIDESAGGCFVTRETCEVVMLQHSATLFCSQVSPLDAG